MSTVIVATILVGLVVGISLLLIQIDKKERRKDLNKHLIHFSALGSKYNMRFSSQEILKNCVIGVDGVHRKLLVLHGINKDNYQTAVIDLSEVKGCAVKKHFENISGRSSKDNKVENYLERIVLHVEFKNGKEAIEIPFYKLFENHIGESLALEQKAKHWQSMLSKMIQAPLKNIA